MTARYRCQICGVGDNNGVRSLDHLLKAHRTAVLQGLGVIETFGTHPEEIVP